MGCFLASVISVALLVVGSVVLVTVLDAQGQREQALRDERERWRDYYWRGDTDQALALLNDFIAHHPKDAEAHDQRATLYAALRQYDDALADCDEAIRLAFLKAPAYSHKAELFLKRGQINEAAATATEALRQDPDWGRAYVIRARARLAQKDYEGAVGDFTSAIRREPHGTDLYVARGNAYFIQKHYASALADYRQAMQIDPERPALYRCAAWLLAVCPDEKFRDGKQALEYAQLYCELRNWDDPEAFDVLAAAYAEFGAFALAVKWEERALEYFDFDDAAGAEPRKRLELYKQERPFRQE
jgi:tetratricopeptide (TPR) repeat protein